MKPEGTAVVTGASRGIGRAVALELAKCGFDVLATMRHPDACSDLPGEYGRGHIKTAALDVTKPDTIRIPSTIRVLVNNAGVEGPYLPVEEAPIEVWRDMFETNLFGLVEVTRRALPHLRKAGGGVLCNVTSCSTLVPVPFFAAYRASKAAVTALSESLRTELAPFGIRILDVAPGAIETDMLEGSRRPPEALDSPTYRPMAQVLQANREASASQVTSAEAAASAIVAAILDDDAPMRVSCDPMSEGILDAWRSTDDETLMRGMLAAFAPAESSAEND